MEVWILYKRDYVFNFVRCGVWGFCICRIGVFIYICYIIERNNRNNVGEVLRDYF